MVNENIAPKDELSVDERIADIEKFLEEQEAKAVTNNKQIVTPTPKLSQALFEGTYKRGIAKGQVTIPSPITNEEMLTVLKKITENQEIDRKRYERNNPITGDESIYDWSEEIINPGQAVEFIYIVPEGHVFYLEYLNVVHNIDSTYEIWIDGVYQPTLTYALQDFGDHMKIYQPPKMAYNTVEVHCLNNWIAAQTYATFFRGWNRFYRSIKREITYEFLEKEKQET